ncbi:MAG TPA: thioredoxin family protein, partial [Isosphaeraceae bacterium]
MRTLLLARRLAPLFIALAVIHNHPAARAADPKPAKKDSRAPRPAQATLSAKVVPAEARPGDTVRLDVTADVSPGWHIYAYNKTQPDDGPSVTQFDPFDLAGLTPKGDWTAKPPPLQKKEPAFPSLPFVSYHEGDVTWSIPLAVPADAAPGKKALRVQAGYMICSDQNCSVPGQWTLPPAELTILPADASAKPKPDDKVTKTAAETAKSDAPPKAPAKKDSSPRFRPPGVELSTSIGSKQARAGDIVTFNVTAKLGPKYHIYKYEKNPEGPGPTWFDFFDTGGLGPQSDWTASKEAHKHDPDSKVAPPLDYYEDEVTWSIPLGVPPGIAPGKKTLRVQAGYQVCDDKKCSVPGQWTLPEAEIEILPGGLAVVSSQCDSPAYKAAMAEMRARSEAEAAAANSDSERETGRGLIPFLLWCAAGGLGALVMPCVWPMVPITVNFFVKQGQARSGKTTGLAVTYCLAIMGIFTGVGLLFAVFLGAGSLSKLANNPWLNFAVAGMLLAFGLSLLGLFEIRLPSFLLNASAQREGRGGLVGVMFMALTLTITSFTCTFPVVGLLLVMAAKGNYIYPILGMLTFSAVLALPFFILALSPGLLSKLPKSGDWMNAVKVVGGLVEIGAAFKFLNTAETAFVVPEEAITNAYTVLAIWVVLALVCGIYLLGLFRTDHDHDAVKVGPGRIVAGCAFLFLSLYLTPALFGRPPHGWLWTQVVGLLPPDAGDLKVPEASPTAVAQHAAKDATSKDPKQAEREQTAVHGVAWGLSYEAALERAKAENKPILIDFTGVNCANCRQMEQSVFPRKEVVAMLERFVPVQLYTDRVPI